MSHGNFACDPHKMPVIYACHLGTTLFIEEMVFKNSLDKIEVPKARGAMNGCRGLRPWGLMKADATLTRLIAVSKPGPGKGPKGVVLQDQTVAAHLPSTSHTHSGSRSKGLHYLFSFLVILHTPGLHHSCSCRRQCLS